MSTDPAIVARPAEVLLSHEARARGFKSTLAFRRWCQRHGVPIAKDGRKEWVRTTDVSAAVESTFVKPIPQNDVVGDAIDKLITGRR